MDPKQPSTSAQAILQRPLDENHPRRKRKGRTTTAQFVLPYDTTLDHFYDIKFAKPIKVPAGSIVALTITLPRQR